MFVSLLKELNLVSLSKVLLKKILFIILLAGYSTAQALTLGEFSVESFLDKPLSAEIIANANSGDNLDSLEVTMANEEEFEQAGIVRSDSLDSFQFELVKVSDEVTRIVVTTEEEISDPYIHMLLKVRWNGGQLLREFTALIDPPLYSSQPVDSVESAVTTTQEIGSSASEQAELSSGTYSDGVYGPVEAGQTLSEIAEEIQESYPDLSIYQIMYVLYQDNKAAFIGENINNLAKDSTLVFDSLDSQQQDIVGRQEGINFFYSQLAEWSASQGTETSTANNESTSSNESVSTEDSSSESTQAAAESSAVDQVDQSVPEDSSQTEESTASTNEPASSAPEFQVASSDIETGAQDSGDVNNQLVSDLEAQVAELEASVESAKLENEELKDTISILETQLADSNRLIELNNQELASLAAQNEANQNQASEVSNTVESEAAKSEPEPVESEPEPAPAEEENLSPVPEASVSIVDKVISFLQGAWRYILILLLGILAIVFLKLRSSKKDEDAIEAFETTFTVYPEDTGDVNVDGEGDINSPESEAKAEELINNIKSEKTKAPEEIANLVDETSESTVMSKLDMDALREATQSVDETVETGEITKESSFLTVYNDGDVIVNADEIDPIAESEVYIAYGREDQGEEVLVDGIKNFPDRNDIKIALLSLYAKSNKQEKFDGVYQTLIDNGVENNAEERATVSDLRIPWMLKRV